MIYSKKAFFACLVGEIIARVERRLQHSWSITGDDAIPAFGTNYMQPDF